MADLQKCPLEHVEKECGHHPYRTKDEYGWYIVQCTCGARGPFAPRDMDIDGWNRPDIMEGVRERAPNSQSDEIAALRKRLGEIENRFHDFVMLHEPVADFNYDGI